MLFRTTANTAALLLALAGRLAADDPGAAPFLVADIDVTGDPYWEACEVLCTAPRYGSLVTQLTAVLDRVVFVANDRQHGWEVWASDGQGATLLADLAPGVDGSDPVMLGAISGRAVFTALVADGGALRRRLYATDGTPAGTQRIALPCEPDCEPASEPLASPALADRLLFVVIADRTTYAGLLYATDGRTEGTQLVTDLGTSFDHSITSAASTDSELLLVVGRSPPRSLWRVRTPELTAEHVADECWDATSLAGLDDRILFVGRCGPGDPPTLYALEPGGVTPLPIAEIPGGADHAVAFAGGTRLAVVSKTGQLWLSNGTPDSTHAVAGVEDVVATTVLDDTLLYQTYHPLHHGLYRLGPGDQSNLLAPTLFVRRLTTLGDHAYFPSAANPAIGLEPWVTDGTSTNTGPLADIAAGPPGSMDATDPSFPGFVRAGELIYFAADDGTHGIELWAVPATTPPTASCTPTSEALCLQGGRFRAEVAWTDFADRSGSGRSTSLTDDTGAFWFFDQQNLELMVKVLDARELDGHFWVFYGALTNVAFTLTVTDTETGAVWTHTNPARQFASGADTRAFAGD